MNQSKIYSGSKNVRWAFASLIFLERSPIFVSKALLLTFFSKIHYYA